jgi:hypothetical protein
MRVAEDRMNLDRHRQFRRSARPTAVPVNREKDSVAPEGNQAPS